MTDEIRINSRYASSLIADYEGLSMSEESTPKRKRVMMGTNEYLEKFVNQINPDAVQNTLTPQNCRYIKSYPTGYTVVVIEEQPAMRSIRVSMDMTRDAESLKNRNEWKEFGYENFFKENVKPYTFMLAVPYVIHILSFSGNSFNRGKIFFRTKPLLGMEDVLYRPPLLNVNSGMSVCYGDSAHRGPQTSIAAETDHVIRVFWSSNFNPDYIDNYNKYRDVAALCDYFTWQHYSKINPMFIYNADWIPANNTIGKYLKNIEEEQVHSRQSFGFKDLSDLFNSPMTTKETVSVGTRSAQRPLVHDICNGWHPTFDLPIYVGDPLAYSKNRVAFIHRFSGIAGRSRPVVIQIKLDDKILKLKLTNKTEQFLIDKIRELRFESSIELPDKSLIKSGDILCMKNNFGNEVYKKVHYIRRSPDDRLELNIGSQYWFSDVIKWDEVSKLNMDNPEVDGIMVAKNVDYRYFTSSYYPQTPIGTFASVKYTGIDTGDNNNLIATFVGPDERRRRTRDYKFSLSQTGVRPKRLYETDKLDDLLKVFFIGRTLLSYLDHTGRLISLKRDKNFGVIADPNDIRESDTSFNVICKECLSKDEQDFNVKSNNVDIEFSVGDKVVVANWKDPLDILRIKTITSFVKNNDAGSLSFMLEDKNGKSSTIEYINTKDHLMNVGKIRKVTNEINGITIGTKIIAKVSGISCFPKKDVNIIVAFVIDTGGEPLALCSNGCTIWFSDLVEKFELIQMKSPEWKKKNHAALDPGKIKLQAGDIVNSTGSYYRTSRGYLVVKNNIHGGIRFARLDYYHDYDDYMDASPPFLKSLVLDCIPNPRITIPKQKLKGFVNGFLTFHGAVSISNGRHSPYKFIDETGRF